ncbi:tail fiber protein proximal subunit [Vibrio phage D480]
MSEFRKAFRASGLDASGSNVVNVAHPRIGEILDGLNLGYFIDENTVQEYDPTRERYNEDFIVEFNQRLYKNIIPITTAEPFNALKWKKMRNDPEWEEVDSSIGANVGDFLFLTASSSITITLPETPLTGDTVTIKDGKGVLSAYPTTVAAAGGLTIQSYGIGGALTSDETMLMNRPSSTVYFVYNGIAWTYQIDHDPYYTYIDAAHPTQQSGHLANGGYVATCEETIAIQAADKTIAISLPLHAVPGDVVRLRDVSTNITQTRIQIGIHPTLDDQQIIHPISGVGAETITLDNIGHAELMYVGGDNNTWVIVISHEAQPWQHLGASSTEQLIVNRRYDININSAVAAMTITLPQSPVDGDWIELSNVKTPGKEVTVQVHPQFGDDDVGHGANEYKIVRSLDEYRMVKYSEFAATVDTFNDSFTINDEDRGYSFILFYDATRKVWDFADISSRIDIVDENHRKRPGLAKLASPTEALAHGIDYAHAEDTGSSWANQNPLKDHVITVETLDARRAAEDQVGIARVALLTTDEALEMSRVITNGNETSRYADSAFRHDIFITPRSFNARTALENRRGVVEIATQNETRSTTNDTQVITPRKFHAAQAEEDLTGVGKLVKASDNINADGTVESTANMRSDRTLNGTDNTVYDKTDHLRFVTAKMLDEYRATENQPGTLWVAKSTELRINDSQVDDAIITPKKFAAWTASSTIRGISRVATLAEARATSGSGEAWDRVFITPSTLNDRTATESRRGVAEIATQTEVDTGTDSTRMIVPLKLKTWLDRDHFVTAGTDGLSHTGTIWDDVTFSIASATETQRGTLQVATQAEADSQSSPLDTVMLTPKKLNSRRATESLAGIVRLATSTEVASGSASNEIVLTPSDLTYWTRTAANSRSSESRYGTTRSATASETFVGDSTNGSSQAYTAYNRHQYAVSPYGLHYALQNYLPLNAKADDSELLDGLNSTQYARSDVDDFIAGTYTFTDNEIKIQGANPRIEFKDTTDNNSTREIYYQSGDIGFTDVENNWQLKVARNGYTNVYGGLEVDGAGSFGSSIYENESSANGRSPGTGTLRTKYLGIDNMAATAAKWETARTVTFSGDLTGSVSFDGSSNVTASVQVNNNSHAHSGENITSGTVSNDRLNKASRTNKGIVQVTSDVRTADPSSTSAEHTALSAGAGKTLSERIDLFTPDGGTGESVKYRDYIQVGSVRMSTTNQGVMEFTFGHAI